MTNDELRAFANFRLAQAIEERPAGLTDDLLRTVLRILDKMDERTNNERK